MHRMRLMPEVAGRPWSARRTTQQDNVRRRDILTNGIWKKEEETGENRQVHVTLEVVVKYNICRRVRSDMRRRENAYFGNSVRRASALLQK